jgi:hypothetical protein
MFHGFYRSKISVVPESMDIQNNQVKVGSPEARTSASADPGTSRPVPSEEVLDMLRSLVHRSHRSSGVQLAESFIRRADSSSSPPPLAILLRGGQGGEVRLKLYLTMLLLAVRQPFDIKDPIPARSWAAVLGIVDPEHNGARRVGDAITWLADHKFLATERRQGTPGAVRLLNPDLSGGPYERPTPKGRYVTLPIGLWNQGWIARLSGTALALLIVLLDMQGGRGEAQWVSPAQARRRYDLSPDTWTKALKELKALGLVIVSRRPQGSTFNYQRMRNAYWVREEMLRGTT